MISTCGHQKRLCCTFTKSCPTIFTNLRDLTILLGVDIVCKPNVKYLFLAILMHCIELHFLTIALDAVICNLIAMVDAFAKFHRLHVGVVDCRMWVISRRLTMCATCHRVLTHIALLQQVKLLFKLRLRLVDFGVEIVACWLDKVTRSSGIFSRESVCKVVKVGGARTDFRSASFLNSFKCCHTHHTLTLNIFWGQLPFHFLISHQTFTRLWTCAAVQCAMWFCTSGISIVSLHRYI